MLIRSPYLVEKNPSLDGNPANLQSDISPFKIDFLDRDGFKLFTSNLSGNIGGWEEVCITGYFSETARKDFESILQMKRTLTIICPEFPVGSNRDRKNLEALTKLAQAGADIRVNNRLHARFLVAYHPGQERLSGILLLGSFDFNTECIGLERHDAGVLICNPDLISKARELFDQIWEESEPPTHNGYTVW